MFDLTQTRRVLMAFCDAIDARDSYTGRHQRGVSTLGGRLAECLGLSVVEAEMIRLGGLIHDVGKLAIPMELLAKTSRLLDEERSLVQTHSRRGLEILKHLELPAPIGHIVRDHHERLDGRGYPAGLRGNAICLGAQIVGVADTFDAMIKPRPYRAAFSLDRTLTELRREAGVTLNADAVAALEELIEEGDEALAEHYGAVLKIPA